MKKPKSAVPLDAGVNRRLVRAGAENIDPDEVGYVQRVKLAYGLERSSWESLKAGKAVRYVFPRAYDGRPPVTVDNEDGPVLEKGRPNVWRELAAFLRKRDVKAPASFIAFCFDSLTHERARAPEPKQLMNAGKVEEYKDHKKKIGYRLRVSLVVQRTTAETNFGYLKYSGIQPDDAWAYVLCDGSLALSPLFRYCVAASIGGGRFDKIAKRWFPDAVMQFERYRGWYRKQWKALLPKGFAAASKHAFPHLVLG